MASDSYEQSCFRSSLRAVMHDACMVRQNLKLDGLSIRSKHPGMNHADNASRLQLPIYVTHAPFLYERGVFMRAQLAALHTEDVTWVECFNRDHAANLTRAALDCLYPCTTFQRTIMSNGTLSLAVKHRLAAFDIMNRNLSAALVLEDDAALPFDLWSQLARVHLPSDAAILHLGSYSVRSTIGTLSFRHGAGCHTRMEESGAPLLSSVHKMQKPIEVWRRNFSCFPTVFGTVAYVLLARGARKHARGPITAPSDFGLTGRNEYKAHGKGRLVCKGPENASFSPSESVPHPSYAVGKWLVNPMSEERAQSTSLPIEFRMHFAEKNSSLKRVSGSHKDGEQ